MLFSVSVTPVGETGSLARPVARVIASIDKAGLAYQVTSMATVIEGEWPDVMPVLERAEAALRQEHGRVFMVITIDDHPGVHGRLHGAVADIEQELGHRPGRGDAS